MSYDRHRRPGLASAAWEGEPPRRGPAAGKRSLTERLPPSAAREPAREGGGAEGSAGRLERAQVGAGHGSPIPPVEGLRAAPPGDHAAGADGAAEAHADAVADRVVAGQSAQDLLDAAPRPGRVAFRASREEPAESPNTCEPAEASEVVVTASTLRVRSAPRTGQDNVVGSYARGARVQVLGREGDWLLVNHDGVDGYIHGGFTRPVEIGPAPEPEVASRPSQEVEPLSPEEQVCLLPDGAADSSPLMSYAGATEATSATATTAGGQDGVTDTTRVESRELLHAEEIFRDVPANTVSKKNAFLRLNRAVASERRKQAAVAGAKNAAARTKAEQELQDARAEVATATAELKAFIVNSRLVRDKEYRRLKEELRAAKKKKDAAKIAELTPALAAYEKQLRADLAEDVDSMRHTDPGHADESVFEPVRTDITHHDFAFPDGEHVKVRDHVVSYATTVSFGVESENDGDREQVKRVMEGAGLSPSRLKILQAISGFEGGFDTVNTYDRAKVTWGYVQWTGGSRSDLTKALAIIKGKFPDAFATSFQAHGIDVVKDEIVITPPDGSPPIHGDDAAEAIMRNPRLAAVMAHAGRNKDIQKGQVAAAVELEIDRALELEVEVGQGKGRTTTTTAGRLITSEYGVGLLANTYVHSGGGAARKAIRRALDRYVAKHPYDPSDAEWAAGAEDAILAALAAKDSDRAVTLRVKLNGARGTFH